ncbi:MAG: hypothetical protein ACTSQI_04055 [Candidatus Helarchaeota archaeon]
MAICPKCGYNPKKQGTIENLVWILPRPRPDYYKGGFPLWFEQKLLRLYSYDYKKSDLKEKVVHLFGGMAEYGFKIDINPEVTPDYIGDAHKLPAEWSNRWEFAICDPPYDDTQSEKLYKTGKIVYRKYIAEAVRIIKPSGYVCSYHWAMTPRPEGTIYHRRIFIGTRIWHKPRVCCIFQKK